MPEMSGYDHGVFSWVDIGTNAREGAVAFYTGLFGWEAQDTGEETGHYTIVSKDGRQVAAISPAQENAGPPFWATYVNVDDVDAVAGKVEAAGGKVVAGPMDVMSFGRMAVLTDPTGAFISAWQARDHIGAQLVNEPGSLVWNELSTSDLAAAKGFYSAVFGWGWAGTEEYAEVQVGGRSIGGAAPRRPELPASVPDHWLVYFASADVDADVQKAVGLGASVMAEPMDIPGTGRIAVVADPQGATFGLFSA